MIRNLTINETARIAEKVETTIDALTPGYWESLRYSDREAERIAELREYFDQNPEWCFICSRPTDHTGEH